MHDLTVLVTDSPRGRAACYLMSWSKLGSIVGMYLVQSAVAISEAGEPGSVLSTLAPRKAFVARKGIFCIS